VEPLLYFDPKQLQYFSIIRISNVKYWGIFNYLVIKKIHKMQDIMDHLKI